MDPSAPKTPRKTKVPAPADREGTPTPKTPKTPKTPGGKRKRIVVKEEEEERGARVRVEEVVGV